MREQINITLFAMIALVAPGCATAKKSGFLSGYDRLHPGHHVESYWSGPGLNHQSLSNLYIEPVDISRAKEEPKVPLGEASSWLKAAVLSSVGKQGGWNAVDQPEKSTSRLALAITYLTPGSFGGRVIAGEFGLGNASVQVEGKLIESATGAELACFTDRRRDSGSMGFEDVAGDAGPKLVKRMLEKLASDLVQELSSSAQ